MSNYLKLFKTIVISIAFAISLVSSSFAINSNEVIDTNISAEIWKNITDEDFKNFNEISYLLKDKKHQEALDLVKNLKSDKKTTGQNFDIYDSLANIILWYKYSKNEDKILFNDISRFINDNEFYPNLSKLKTNAEEIAAKQEIPFSIIEQYFTKNTPETLEPRLFFLNAKIKFLSTIRESDSRYQKIKQEITKEISNIWIDENFSESRERDFLNKYKNYLSKFDHINRIDRLLWDGKILDAKRIMDFVDKDYQKLFTAVSELQLNPPYIDKIILSVPRYLRSNEGLLYREAMWYKSKDKIENLSDLIVRLPKSTQFPQKWWKLRHLYAREMLKTKEYKTAYYLVKDHGLTPKDKDFWEAEWTSGWIALRFVDKPKEAIISFKNLFNNVEQPVTLSRASYWVAMSAEAMGDKEEAKKWYQTASQYPIFFYGQLAIHKSRILDPLNPQNDTILPEEPKVTKIDIARLANSQILQIAYFLYKLDDKDSAKEIFKWLVANAKNKTDIAVIMKLVNELKDRVLDVEVSRVASKKDVFFVRDKFQIIEQIEDNKYSPLVHAIIKQESGFVKTAVSRVGALGFMQLMPDTAKQVSKDMGISYNKSKLTTDVEYNIKLGSFYIKQMIDRFDGSELLAIASYNAGPHNADRWIREFYDPRIQKDIDKVVDWIELISYSETRNYVQRIMENMIVYKYIMSRKNYDSVK